MRGQKGGREGGLVGQADALGCDEIYAPVLELGDDVHDNSAEQHQKD